MSNKKRINNRIKSIQNKDRLRVMNNLCTWLVNIIKSAEQVKRSFKKLALAYESGRSTEPEKIIDSHGDEMVIPKFEIKRHPYFLNTHNPEQS